MEDSLALAIIMALRVALPIGMAVRHAVLVVPFTSAGGTCPGVRWIAVAWLPLVARTGITIYMSATPAAKASDDAVGEDCFSWHRAQSIAARSDRQVIGQIFWNIGCDFFPTRPAGKQDSVHIVRHGTQHVLVRVDRHRSQFQETLKVRLGLPVLCR
jgi:hypothetical protein